MYNSPKNCPKQFNLKLLLNYLRNNTTGNGHIITGYTNINLLGDSKLLEGYKHFFFILPRFLY